MEANIFTTYRCWLLLGLLLVGKLSLLAAQPTVTNFTLTRPSGADYTTSGAPANATALEVPTNNFTITLEFSEAVTPANSFSGGGSNAKFDTKNEIADLLVLQLGGGSNATGPDLITPGTLASVASDMSHSADGKTITVHLKLALTLGAGQTYTLILDTNQVVAATNATIKAAPFSAVLTTAKAITIVPATPTTTLCNSGNPRVLPPVAFNEQSVGSFVVGAGTMVLAFDNPDIKITKAPTVAVIGAPGDFLVPVATVTSDGKFELAYNFTAFNEVSGILLSGIEVASTSSVNLSGVSLKPVSGFKNLTGMDGGTTLATINAVNITSIDAPVRPANIEGFDTVCIGGIGFTYVAIPVAGVTGYHWELPTGFITTDPDATLIPASGAYYTPDNQITVAVAGTASLGTYALQVRSATDCQVSAFARSKTITVAPAPNPQVTLLAPRFSLKTTTAVPITVTNFPAGGIGVLRGDGVLGDKLYPNLLVAGKNYKVYY
ncbi:MAG TPA: hypothetical protein DCS93_23445, partial [Microscillaceae bacterium]|nr:hypothetical protein [Microscillaceae bacterium]